MSDHRPRRDSMSFEEATIFNMWEIAAIVEVLGRKSLCTKQDLYDISTELCPKNSRTRISENFKYSTSRLGRPKRLASSVKCGREGYAFCF